MSWFNTGWVWYSLSSLAMLSGSWVGLGLVPEQRVVFGAELLIVLDILSKKDLDGRGKV